MASRSLNVSITGDSRDLQRALGQAGKSTADFEKKASASSRATGLAFKSLAGVAGVGAVAVALKSTVKAAIDAEASQAKVQKMVENAGLSWSKYGDHIDNVIQKQSRLTGLDDEELAESFANMLRSTNDVNKALELNALAADVARTKGTGLAQSQSLIARVYNGSYTGLKRLGIAFEPVTKAQDKLKESTKKATTEQVDAAKKADNLASRHKAIAALQQKFGGQAEAYGKTAAGAQDRFRVAVENLQEKLGSALLPALTDVSSKAAKFVDEMTNGEGAGGRFAKKMEHVFGTVKQVAGVLRDAAKWLGQHPGLLAAAGGAWVAYKTTALVQMAAVKAAELGLFGGKTRARVAGEAGKAGTSVGKNFAAKAGLAVAAGVAGWEIGTWARKHSGAARSAGDFLGKNLAQALGQAGDNKLDEFVQKWRDTIQSTFSGLQGSLNDSINQVNNAALGAGTKSGIRGQKKGTNKPPRAKNQSTSKSKRMLSGSIIATASGEAGGAELGSLQSALAWVHANFPSLNAFVENPGTSNQHLHINGDPGLIIQAGQGLQSRGYSIGEYSGSPSVGFGPITTSHQTHGGGQGIDVNSDYRSLSISGGGGGSTTPAKTVTAAAPKKPKKLKAERLPSWSWDANFAPKLDRVDLQVSAGVLSPRQGLARKRKVIAGALKILTGNQRLKALAALNDLTEDTGDPASVLSDVPAEAPENLFAQQQHEGTLGQLGGILDNIDAQVRAGDITPERGVEMKKNVLDKFIKNGASWGLTSTEITSLRGDVRELEADKSTSAADLKAAIDALTDEMKKGNAHAAAVRGTSLAALWGTVADMVSGQIAGYGGYMGKAATAGAGSTYRL